MSKLISIEKTFLMIKPDGVKRGLIGEIFSRLERVGLKLVASRMIWPTREQAAGNYPGTDDWLIVMGEKTYLNYNNDQAAIKEDLGTVDRKEIGQKVYDGLVNYLTEGPVVLTVWEGNHAVEIVRKLVGKTIPTVADVGSIRGDFGFDTPMLAVKSGRITVRTLIHTSDEASEAKREIKHWFGDNYKDLSDYERLDYVGSYEVLN